MAKRIVETVKAGKKNTKPLGSGRKAVYWAGGVSLALLVVFGVFAQNGWLPRTDPLSGEGTGWFGVKFTKHATGSNWNPLANPSPTPRTGLKSSLRTRRTRTLTRFTNMTGKGTG